MASSSSLHSCINAELSGFITVSTVWSNRFEVVVVLAFDERGWSETGSDWECGMDGTTTVSFSIPKRKMDLKSE